MINHNESIGFKGHYQFIRATEQQITGFIVDRIPEFSAIDVLESLAEGSWATKIWLALLRSGVPEFCTVDEYDNLVPSVLKNSLATLISGTTVAPTFKAKYLALGTGSTAPAAADTQLQTETVRASFAQTLSINNVAYLNAYFANASVAGNTYTEVGIFVDGTASANSGYILSHAAINQAIGSNQTLTVNATITLS